MQRDLPSPQPSRPDAEVERVVFASIVANMQGVYGEMERIRESAMRHNKRAGIHAGLLCRSGWFLMWLEGPKDALQELIEKISKDPRHRSPVFVHHSRGRRYLPTRWSMMLDASTEPATGFARRVMDLRDQLKKGRQYPPTSVVRRLVAPFRLLDGENVDPEAYHRIGVCSADNSRAFELVRWLAAKNGTVSESRRYAGEQDLDSGSDYVDLIQDGMPCRVIAVSRASLQHGLRRAFMPDWPHLVLLFGDNAKRNDALVERVCLACKDMPTPPELLGVAADQAVHERMQACARDARLAYRSLGILECQEYHEVWKAIVGRVKEAGPPSASQWDVTEPAWSTSN